MAKRKSSVSLPDWATPLWKELGSPDLDAHLSVASGDLFDRRHGLRRDDIVEVLLDVRAIPEGDDPWVRGRMMSRTPTSIEILTIEGRHVYIAREVVAIAIVGLRRRGRLDARDRDETIYLEGLAEIAETGVTPAEHLLALYHGRWNQSVDPVFTEFAY